MMTTVALALWLAVMAFCAGWFAHRRRTFWASRHVAGVLEQWIEHEIRDRLDLYANEGRRSTLLGSGSLETLDGIVAEVMERQRMPPLFFGKRRSPLRRRRAGVSE